MYTLRLSADYDSNRRRWSLLIKGSKYTFYLRMRQPPGGSHVGAISKMAPAGYAIIW